MTNWLKLVKVTLWMISDKKVGCDVSHQLLENRTMPDYRRWFREGGTYFFTVVTYNRRNIFSNELARSFLHRAIAEVMAFRPFEMQGIVLLPNHCHCIWKMPDDDENFSVRWQMIKRRFTKSWLNRRGDDVPVSVSRTKRGERGVWQRRFWEHLIVDQQDLARHMDYIHYNPVKHRYTRCPHQWEHSSFHRWVREGVYEMDWVCQCNQDNEIPDFKDIAHSVGE
jgi:putative transposase